MLLSIENLSKGFPGVRALDAVSFNVFAGEVHALLGENGAGKSTLLKVISSAHPPDSGVIAFNGAPLDPRDSPGRRQTLGIVTIYQEFNLAPNLSVAENIFLGREPVRRGWLDSRRMCADAHAALAKLGGGVPPEAIVRDLSVAEQQLVEIARALTLDAKLIIMDEPTAALSAREVTRLHEVISGLRQEGVAIVYVTHRLDEVKAIADRYTVLRDGRVVGGGKVGGAVIADFVRAMVGRDVPPAPTRGRRRGDIALEAELGGQSLLLHAGEIVGMAGLVGAGRTAFARAIFGAEPGAVVTLPGGERRIFFTPADAMRNGVAMVPEDRKEQGCFLSHPLLWNLTLPSLPRLTKAGFIDHGAERALGQSLIERLHIRAPSADVAIGALSGGNQQKALFARSVAINPRVLIVDEPTRGVDIGAKAEVHRILFELAAAGVAILAISSDLPEILQISDRILVMRDGRLLGQAPAQTSEEALMLMMTGQAA